MKIRIFSDLHLDVNFRIGHEIPEVPQDDVLNIICGDISGDFAYANYWLKQNIKNGIFIKGNHDKSYCSYENRWPINQPDLELLTLYPKTHTTTYLFNDYKIIDDVVFIGTTLWTDYTYGNGGNREYNMRLAQVRINDCRFGVYHDKGDNYTPLQTENCLQEHERAVKFIEQTLSTFVSRKCVLITHHCMSPKCIDDQYKNSELNASFVSNMERFIARHPNLVLVCSGHMHTTKDFMVGNTRYIVNSYGYGSENPNYNNNLVVEV